MLKITKIEDHTKQAINETDLAIKRALETIGGKMVGYATELCPTGTPESTGIPGYIGGTLKQSIAYVTTLHEGLTVEVDKESANPYLELHGGKQVSASTDEENTVFIGTNVFYAPYVELGTSKMKPRPFIKPAIQNHINEYKHILKNELKKVGK